MHFKKSTSNSTEYLTGSDAILFEESNAMPRIFIVLTLLLLTGAACSPLPAKPAERALYQDMRQVVETRERGEWIIEYSEVERATPKAMQSVCQVETETVRDVADWIDEEIARTGGTAEEQFEDGVPRRKLDDTLTLQRSRAVLESAESKRDQCPFFLRPEGEFDGVHRTTKRFVVLGESVGSASLSIRGTSTFTGAGGAGRLLPSWGISHRLLIGIGLEVGGAAGFEPLSGESEEELETRVQAAVPLLIRFSDLTRVYDIEFAATGITSPTDVAPEYGFRTSIAGGVTTVRINKLLPHFALMVGYQYFPWTEPATHMLTAGSRFGFAFDP